MNHHIRFPVSMLMAPVDPERDDDIAAAASDARDISTDGLGHDLNGDVGAAIVLLARIAGKLETLRQRDDYPRLTKPHHSVGVCRCDLIALRADLTSGAAL